ncbi:MAG: hypothetical protein RLZZ58_906 [Pseudomonadota bacterium]
MTAAAPPAYAAIAMQLTAQSADHCADRSAVAAHVRSMTDALAGKIRAAAIFVTQYGGTPVRLVVLPEYLFTSYPGRIGIADYADRVAFDMDGGEYAALGALAAAQNIYLAVNAYERDPHFPGLYFQACVLLAPDGGVALRYRRLNSMFAPTPHDVWDRYLDIYGQAGVFPVADTEIGRIAAIASEEILYPEIARAHALRGAEIFVHNSSEIGSPLATPKAIAKRARAFENAAYVVSANTAGISGTALPMASADGNSMVVDYKGAVLAESNGGETFTAAADIDLAALRAHRRKPGMTNMLARQRLGLFAASYATDDHQAANMMLDGDGNIAVPDRDQFLRRHEAVIARLDKDGLI